MGELLAFVGVAAVVIVVPGQDTALVLRNTLAGRRPGGVRTAAGVVGGLTVWALAASAGLAALIVASEPAIVAIKLVGAIYLAFLGIQSLLVAIRGHTADPEARPTDSGRALRQGLLSTLGNPKIAVLFTSLLPQFGDPFAALPGLGLLLCAMGLAWLWAYAGVVARAGDVLRRPRVRRALDALTGGVLIGLGARLATASRQG